jgi:hypothetical protein
MPRREILGIYLGDGKHIAILHDVIQGQAIMAQILHPADLKPADIVGMMYHLHGVRIVKIDLVFRRNQDYTSP